MGCIYKITNTVNGKIYIGKTIHTAMERWQKHLYQASGKVRTRDSYLHRAIRKYGKEKFVCETVQEASNDILDELERYWIKQYDAMNSGYNLTLGGDGKLKITDADLLEMWYSGCSVGEIVEYTGCCIKTIGDRLHDLGISKKEIAKRGRIISAKKMQKIVYMYDLEGNYLDQFDSIGDANIFINIHNGVGPVLDKNRSAGGYQWRTSKVDNIGPYVRITPKGNTVKGPRDSCKKKPVAMLSEDGKILKRFISISEAAKSVNAINSTISRACQNPWRTVCGYHWKLI
jgi:group I intron endonuclease